MARLDALDGHTDVTEEESNANWQEWCAGMDGMGALVMLAPTLDIA